MDAKKYETPSVVMNQEKQQARNLVAARAQFAKKRNKVVRHTPNPGVDLTKPSSLIKGRIEFTENRIEINHLLTDMINARLGKNQNANVEKMVAKLAKKESQNVVNSYNY